jgi:hypothetical protein
VVIVRLLVGNINAGFVEACCNARMALWLRLRIKTAFDFAERNPHRCNGRRSGIIGAPLAARTFGHSLCPL